jgi:hypothetical protein
MARAFIANINVHLASKAHVDLDGRVAGWAMEGEDRVVQPAAEARMLFGEGRNKGFPGEVPGEADADRSDRGLGHVRSRVIERDGPV